MIYARTIEHGIVPNVSVKPVAESNLLINSVRVTPVRTKQTYLGDEGEDIGLRYRNPTMSFAFEGFIIAEAGFSVQHPGTEVPTLANFAGVLHGFDPVDGTMVFEDPTRDLQRGDDSPYSFTVMHHPYVVDA